MQEAKREDHGKETDDRKIFGKVSMKHVTPTWARRKLWRWWSPTPI